MHEGISERTDTVIVDTAGRLHTKAELMEELGKIKRVIKRQAAVDEVLLVLDATTGQNGLRQARVFAEAVDVTGIVLTKLDGTAKGGIVVAVQRELGVPVKLVGLVRAPTTSRPRARDVRRRHPGRLTWAPACRERADACLRAGAGCPASGPGLLNWEMRWLLPTQGMVNWLVMHTSCRDAINDHITNLAASDANAGIAPHTPVSSANAGNVRPFSSRLACQ